MSESTPFSGSAVLIIDERGRLLLQQRDDDGPEPGYGRWAIPGGGREGEETPLQTALREMAEETTVRLRRLHHWGTVTRTTMPFLDGPERHIFLCDDHVPRERIEVREGLDFQYWSPEEIAGLPINPHTRALIERIIAGPLYRELTARPEVAVIGIDRWGALLVCAPAGDNGEREAGAPWGLPRGPMRPNEAPDSAALRVFDAATGHVLDRLRLLDLFRPGGALAGVEAPVLHVYYDDPDIDVDLIDGPSGLVYRYVAPDEVAGAELGEMDRALLAHFVAGTAYRAMFH